MTTVHEYRKATAELIIKLLQEAERANVDLDKFLAKIMREATDRLIAELRKLAEQGKIDLSKGINLRDYPEIYHVLKELEKETWKKIDEFAWIGMQVMTNHLSSVYKTTTNSTYQIFSNWNTTPQTSIPSQKSLPNIKTPQTLITDTYITKDVLQIPWCKDGKTYSQRLYNNVANFESKLAFVLEEGLTKGKGIEWMQNAWRKLTGAAAYETARLIKTETMAFWSEATKRAYLDMGIQYVTIVGDAACGTICTEFTASDPIPLAEAETGGLLPPYHPFCACSYIAYIEPAETDDIE